MKPFRMLRKLFRIFIQLPSLKQTAGYFYLRFTAGKKRDSARTLEPITLSPTILGGAKILCRPYTTDYYSLNDLLFRHFNVPIAELTNPKMIIDLGVNIGYTVAHFACLYPTARIIGLEPDKENYDLAIRNTSRWENRVTLINSAIWSSSGWVYLEGNKEDAYKVSIQSDGNLPGINVGRKVPAITMNDILGKYGIQEIDHLKIDIEGAEQEILLDREANWLEIVNTLRVEIHEKSKYKSYEDVLGKYGFICKKDEKGKCAINAERP